MILHTCLTSHITPESILEWSTHSHFAKQFLFCRCQALELITVIQILAHCPLHSFYKVRFLLFVVVYTSLDLCLSLTLSLAYICVCCLQFARLLPVSDLTQVCLSDAPCGGGGCLFYLITVNYITEMFNFLYIIH